MPRRNRISKWSYFIEFIIIIAGITVSFLLNEWRENKKNETKKSHLLYEINNDLYTDSLVLEYMSKFYVQMRNSHDSLLFNREKNVHPDSLDKYLDHLTSYFPFNEIANTYKKINSDNELTIDKEDSLIWYYLNLHNIVYPSMHEWLYVEKDFVLKTAIPYMDKNAPFIYPTPHNKSFSGKVFYKLRKEDEFMNYIKSGRVYKNAMNEVIKGVLDYVKTIKVAIRLKIKQMEKAEKD